MTLTSLNFTEHAQLRPLLPGFCLPAERFPHLFPSCGGGGLCPQRQVSSQGEEAQCKDLNLTGPHDSYT